MDLTNECNEICIRKTTSEDGVVYMDTIQFPHVKSRAVPDEGSNAGRSD